MVATNVGANSGSLLFVGKWNHDNVKDLVFAVAADVVASTKWMFNTGWPSPLSPINTTKSYFYVHEFCRARKNSSVSKSKFFVYAPEKHECNAIDGECFPSKNREKSAIFASDSHTWRMNSTTNWSRFEWCSPARKIKKRHRFDRYRDDFSVAKVNSLAKFANGLCCFSSYHRGFSARLASNSTMFSHSNMRPIAYFIFGIVSLHARPTLILQGLSAEFHTDSDSFGHENSLTEMRLTMLFLVENVIETSSCVGAAAVKFRYQQQVHALYTDRGCGTPTSLRQLASPVLSGVNHG